MHQDSLGLHAEVADRPEVEFQQRWGQGFELPAHWLADARAVHRQGPRRPATCGLTS
jgi:hypothetical protein